MIILKNQHASLKTPNKHPNNEASKTHQTTTVTAIPMTKNKDITDNFSQSCCKCVLLHASLKHTVSHHSVFTGSKSGSIAPL